MPNSGGVVVDTRGEKCPLPVLRMEKRLGALKDGETLTVLATDPVAKIDIPLYCRQHGHACTLESVGEELRFSIGKNGG